MDIATRPTAPLQETAQKAPKRGRIWPAVLALYVLAAIIPECVATYNTAPRSFLFNPALFFFETAFYGSANLLIRELVRRRKRRWASLLLLGAAFGFVNEGIIAGTWYTVVPNGFAMIGGVDWAWAVALTAFHTIYSVVIPILLVEAIFPALADQPWLKRRGLIGFSLLLALTTLVGLLAPAYRLDRFLVLLAVVVLTLIALRLPLITRPRQESSRAAPGLFRLRAAGFVGTLLFFGAIILAPALLARAIAPTYSELAQALYILCTLAACALLLLFTRRWTARHGWGHAQNLALITGALLPTILLSVLLPQEWLAAQPVATLSCLALLIWLARRTRPQGAGNPEAWANAPFREYK